MVTLDKNEWLNHNEDITVAWNTFVHTVQKGAVIRSVTQLTFQFVKHDTVFQCCFNAVPASKHHWTNVSYPLRLFVWSHRQCDDGCLLRCCLRADGPPPTDVWVLQSSPSGRKIQVPVQRWANVVRRWPSAEQTPLSIYLSQWTEAVRQPSIMTFIRRDLRRSFPFAPGGGRPIFQK